MTQTVPRTLSDAEDASSPQFQKATGINMDINYLVKKWWNLSDSCSEADLKAQFTNNIWDFLGLKYSAETPIEGGIKPDYIVCDRSGNPCLVVETKKRVSQLAKLPDSKFYAACKTSKYYLDAVGGNEDNNNGVREYLKVKSCPARYGLAFNGDFFQLFRQVDGLVFPLTDIQRVTRETIPSLIGQLQHYLETPKSAFVCSVWNRKGGVAKTTNIINMAAVLSAYGKKVLVVDFDPQVDLTKSFGFTSDKKFGQFFSGCLEKIQLGKREEARKIALEWIQSKTFKLKTKDGIKECSISVLPNEKETLEKFSNDEEYSMRNKDTALRRILSLISSEYDYIFIDTSPKADLLTISSLIAADGLIVPIDCDPETLRHAKSIISESIPKEVRQYRKTLQSKKSSLNECSPVILGLVLSNWPDLGVKMQKQIDQKLSTFHAKVYQTQIKRYDTVQLAKFHKKPVFFDSPSSPAAKLYLKLTQEIFLHPNFID